MEKRINISSRPSCQSFNEKKMVEELLKNSEEPNLYFEYLLHYHYTISSFPYYSEKLEELPTDYLVELFLWAPHCINLLHDWTIFSPKQFGKLVARLGTQVSGTCATIPVFNTDDWVHILRRTAESKQYTDEQKNEIYQQCPWLYFTPQHYAKIYAICDELNNRIIEAVQHFSHEDWCNFLMNTSYGIDFVLLCPDYDKILEEIKQRDYNDSHRAVAPLKQADDATLADTTECNLEEAIELLLSIIENKMK
jgi:hypothetical protein